MRDKRMQKTEHIVIRCSILERQAAHVIAAGEGLTLSGVIRVAVREAAERRGCWPPAIKVENLTEEEIDDIMALEES